MTAPPFAYYGGKTMLADKIVALLPLHRHYVEPFAGSLAVLLAKPRADHETVNDLDGDLMLFWRMLRDHPAELAAAASLTPHSRAEHLAAYDLDSAPTDLERARCVWVMLSQGRSGTMRRTGWRFYRNPSGSNSSMPDYLAAYADRIPPAAKRLHGVSLECRNALDIVRDYGQEPEALIYADPPYSASTGRSLNYRIEAPGETFHRELADALHAARAAVVLSGYASDLYDQHLYADWCRVELAAFTGQGANNGKRTEVLWSNRDLAGHHLFSPVPA